MRKFIVNDQIQLGQLATACQMLKEGNAMLALGKKKADAGKQAIIHWLASERATNVEALEIGEIIIIQGEKGDLIKLEIKGKNRLDQESLQLHAPEVFAAHYKLFPEKSFGILLDAETLASLRMAIAGKIERAEELKKTLLDIGKASMFGEK